MASFLSLAFQISIFYMSDLQISPLPPPSALPGPKGPVLLGLRGVRAADCTQLSCLPYSNIVTDAKGQVLKSRLLFISGYFILS